MDSQDARCKNPGVSERVVRWLGRWWIRALGMAVVVMAGVLVSSADSDGIRLPSSDWHQAVVGAAATAPTAAGGTSVTVSYAGTATVSSTEQLGLGYVDQSDANLTFSESETFGGSPLRPVTPVQFAASGMISESNTAPSATATENCSGSLYAASGSFPYNGVLDAFPAGTPGDVAITAVLPQGQPEVLSTGSGDCASANSYVFGFASDVPALEAALCPACQTPILLPLDKGFLSESFPVNQTVTEGVTTTTMTITDMLTATASCQLPSSTGSAASGELLAGSLDGRVVRAGDSAAAAPGPIATMAAHKLVVRAGPHGDPQVTVLRYKLSADVSCSHPPNTFVWKRVPTKSDSPYLKVIPNPKQVKVTVNATSTILQLTMKCRLPAAVRRNSPESWRPCHSIVFFQVTVTDSAGGKGTDEAGFIADPQCSSPSRKVVAREKLDNLAADIWGELPAWLGKEAGKKLIEKLLEAGELGPYLLAHGLTDLSGDILSQIREANGARADLALPDC